jgi:hypothetical protein
MIILDIYEIEEVIREAVHEIRTPNLPDVVYEPKTLTYLLTTLTRRLIC